MRPAFYRSLQGKLIVGSVAIVLIVLALAGFIFILLSRGDERHRELDHVTANSGAIHSEFLLRQVRGDSEDSLKQFVREAAKTYDVRILMIDAGRRVITDSAGDLQGQQLRLNERTDKLENEKGLAYVTFQPAPDSPGSNLVLVAEGNDLFPSFTIQISAPGGFPIRYGLVLAIAQDTLTTAWLRLLPALAIAAGIAIPAAILLAIIIARYITRPLEQLTKASLAMASGRFDVEVSLDRRDEVGRLARAFRTMAERVGDAQTKMRNLLANVSHDMKTPLTSILGFSQALRDEEQTDESESRRMAAIINEEAQRLSTRINDLLYLSELESGQVVLKREETDMPSLMRGTLARVQPELDRRKIEVSAELPPLTLPTDSQKLERVIENLLDNARKFTADGGRIEVRSSATRDPGGAWIEIANTAQGVDEEELPKLFERFYRRDRSRPALDGRRQRQMGSGLGLPIARDLVALLGGSLNASLRDGLIVFRIELPTPPGA